MDGLANQAFLSTAGAIVAMLVSITSAIIMILKHKNSAPIDKRTAELATTTALAAASKTHVDTALALNVKLTSENTRLDSELSSERRKVSQWEQWFTRIMSGWSVIRSSENPPAGPIYEREESK